MILEVDYDATIRSNYIRLELVCWDFDGLRADF
jgi:hypothetical protein